MDAIFNTRTKRFGLSNSSLAKQRFEATAEHYLPPKRTLRRPVGRVGPQVRVIYKVLAEPAAMGFWVNQRLTMGTLGRSEAGGKKVVLCRRNGDSFIATSY